MYRLLIALAFCLPAVTHAQDTAALTDVVVTGTLKEVSRAASPVPVEIITSKLFRKNPTPSLFEAVGMINGVQPQLNCNVCNTGDIHINGMEGPYTLVLIDGMPIVSSLATVYGLSGIPNSIVERIEVVKGPASSLYGSEAMGGTINVITRQPFRAPRLSVDVFGTSWQECSADISGKLRMGKAQGLLGISYFNYQHPADHNGDGFTDVTLQHRISVFNKWSLARPQGRIASLALRYVYEDRWGGQMSWSRRWRGTDSIYGESIYTSRYEAIGMYQLPLREKVMLQLSYNWHGQDSYYGTTPYQAQQQVAFAQAYWEKTLGRQGLLLGAACRYTFYDDNTPGTATPDTLHPQNAPACTPLPGAFLQDQWTLSPHHTLLAGYRYDYDRYHGSIHSPRLAYKWAPNERQVLRASFGTGFRVVNLFTEDHAALTGARRVVIEEELRPERSYNANLNYEHRIDAPAALVRLDATAFYTYFTNKIIGDFDTRPDEIRYHNLRGHAVSGGFSLNADASFSFPLRALLGVTWMNVYQVEQDASGEAHRTAQLYAPQWSGNFILTYNLPRHYSFDLTGKVNGPMRLPVQPGDYRPDYSPWYCVANLQLTHQVRKGLEVYGGLKNLLNFVPKDPIMRPEDPFNKQADDPVSNPRHYTFDPSYNYASMQGIRLFLGIRYSLQ